MIIFGFLEDQLTTISWFLNSSVLLTNYIDYIPYNYTFYQFFFPLFTNQPITWTLLSALGRTQSIYLYNIYLFTILLISFYSSNILFKRFFPNISVFLAFIFVFSPYVYAHFGRHHELLNIYLYPILILLLLSTYKKITIKKSIMFVACIVFSTLISNYIGFFLLLILLFYSFVEFFINLSIFPVLKALKVLFYKLIVIASSILFLYISLFSYFNTNLFGAGSSIIDLSGRPLEDFFYFTSRPWYYFLPSPENPWFGNLTIQAIDWLQNDWGYWLTTNYFPSEHTSSYLGIVNILFAFIGFIYVIKKVFEFSTKEIRFFGIKFTLLRLKIRKRGVKSAYMRTQEYYLPVFILGIVAFIMFIFSLPPYFTIALKKIYMPSYILWEYLPMFRALSRLGIFIFLVVLIYTGYGYIAIVGYIKLYLSKIIKSRGSFRKYTRFILSNWRIFTVVFFLPIFIVSLLEFYTVIYVTRITRAPEVYEYLGSTYGDSKIVVYPYEKVPNSLLWLGTSTSKVYNASKYDTKGNIINSNIFTENLVNCTGATLASAEGVRFLVYYYNVTGDKNLFANNPALELVAEFKGDIPDEEDYTYYKILNVGDTIGSSTLLYKIRELDKFHCE